MAKLSSRKLGPHERDSHRRRLLDLLKQHGKKVQSVQLARGRSQAMWEPFLVFPDEEEGIDWALYDAADIARVVASSAELDAKQQGPGWYGVQLIGEDGESLDAPVFFPVGLEGMLSQQDARSDVLLESCRFLQWQNREFTHRTFKALDKIESVLELLVDAPLANIEVEKLRLESDLEEFRIEHETRRQAQEHMWQKFGKFAKPIGKAVGDVFQSAAKNFDFGPDTGKDGIDDDDDEDDDEDDDKIPPREPLDRTAPKPSYPFQSKTAAVLEPLSDDERASVAALLGADMWKLLEGASQSSNDEEAGQLIRKLLLILTDLTKDENDKLLNDLAVVIGFTSMPKIGELLNAAKKL